MTDRRACLRRGHLYAFKLFDRDLRKARGEKSFQQGEAPLAQADFTKGDDLATTGTPETSRGRSTGQMAAAAAPHLMLCTCEGTFAPNPDRIAAGERSGAAPGWSGCSLHDNLCRRNANAVAALLESGAPLVIACGQEAATFEDMAAEAGRDGGVACVDIRDRAGWARDLDSANAQAKMAALLAEARLAPPHTPTREQTSEGVCLVYGAGETALAAAERLSATLSVTCLLSAPGDAMAPVRTLFPIVSGRVAGASGYLGAFSIRVDGFADMEPGGRGGLRFGQPRDGARSQCDLIVDLSGGQPLFPTHEKRDGYLRADPGDPLAVERVLFDATQYVGTFEKPLYIRFEASKCAHQRAQRPGCTRCLDVCPTGAITVGNGGRADAVTIDPDICAGCGSCAAVCPSGAALTDYPPFEFQLQRLRTLHDAYVAHGGAAGPRLLIHDAAHGGEMIALAARFGDGLPGDVIPFAVEETGGVGHALIVAARATGFSTVQILAGPKGDRALLEREIALANTLIDGVAHTHGASTVAGLIDVADPDALSTTLFETEQMPASASPLQRVLLLGEPRETVRVAMTALAGDTPPDAPIPLPDGAPYGRIDINQDACTLCLACVSLCPSGALTDNPDRPEVRFQEDACLQCGVCRSTCPEGAISLHAQFDVSRDALAFKVLHEEEPFACISCGKLFGVKSTIERVMEKLSGQHWMFTNSDNAKLIQMCDDCRVQAQFHGGTAPFQMGSPRKVRTTDDYLSDDGQNDGEA